MGILYHGSSQKGITRLEPHKSTHGCYVYATPYKELAIIFSSKCGDDYTYALYRYKKTDPWILVERIPEAFNAMFNNSASIYTLSDETFKEIHTGFPEMVSKVGVNVCNEEHLDSVYAAIKNMANEGKIKLYAYPEKPNDMPMDSSDLIDKLIRQHQRNNQKVRKKSFERLILLHPYLIDKVNQKMQELSLNVKPYQKEDLIWLFENTVVKQAVYPEKEQYLKSIVISISNSYPELLSVLNEKLLILNKSKVEKIAILINNLPNMFQNIPATFILQLGIKYSKDERSFSEIGKEILELFKKAELTGQIISENINLEDSNRKSI